MREQTRVVMQWVLRSWLAFGVLAVLALPRARSVDALIGWLPFWLVLVPALMAWQLQRLVVAAKAAPTIPLPPSVGAALAATTARPSIAPRTRAHRPRVAYARAMAARAAPTRQPRFSR